MGTALRAFAHPTPLKTVELHTPALFCSIVGWAKQSEACPSKSAESLALERQGGKMTQY
jgi:hypothetical protein